MQALVSQYIFADHELQQHKAILVDNDSIIDVISNTSIPSHISVINCGNGHVISPGFIDLQVNGCGGVLFNNHIHTDTLEAMYQTWLHYGTTSFLPTLITCDFAQVIQALETVKHWFNQFGNTRGVVGIHLEGPFISVIKKGIHPEKFILAPSLELLKKIVLYRQFFPIKMTIAVEVFTDAQIQFLLDHDIILSLGHTNASYAQAKAGIDLGVATATHVFNTMTGLTARNPGVLGAILNTNIYTGVIVDLFHVDPVNIQLLLQLKSDKVYLVSDSVTPTGTDMQQFQLMDKTLYVRNNKCVNADGVLGGAYLTMNQAVANCVNECAVSLTDSLAMATIIPARVMHLDSTLGEIKPGYRANLIDLNLLDFSCKTIFPAANKA